MAFEPIYEKPAYDCLKRIASGQAVVEARLLPDGGAQIAKVLSIATDCVVTPSEVFAGEARYSGRVSFKVLYVDSNGANHSLDYNADFTDKLMHNELIAGLKPIMTATVLDTDIVWVSEGEIKLACVAEVNLNVVMSEQMRCLTSGGDNIYTHDDRLDFCKMTSVADQNFSVTNALPGVKASKVLISEARAIVTRRAANLDSVTIEGSVINDLCCESEDGSIFGYQLVTAFSEEIPSPGAHADNVVCVFTKINNCRVNIEMDGDANFSIAAEYNLNACATTFAGASINPIVDAFSVKNELLLEGSSVKICRNKCNETIADRVEGSVTLDTNMPIADNILAVTGARLTVSNAVPGDERLVLEGIASCNIIYYSAEMNSKNSVAVELPFSITVNADVAIGDSVSAWGQITALSTKIRRGSEIDIKADISVEYTAAGEDVKYIITELKMGEERALPTGAFAIHIARGGENLWDVAKALSTTPELVLLQNPGLVLPLNGGERVISYRHLK